MPTTPKIFVPPGGFMGFAQQSVATQALIQGQGRRKTKRKTKKKAAKKKTARKRPAATRKSAAKKKTPARMVKGSAAAKRHMKKLRNMRK